MDEKPTAHLTSSERDICTCFNYNELTSPDTDRWQEYDDIVIVAWSMGVWAAEQVVARLGLSYSSAYAVNGTPRPVDDQEGIPVAIARGTYDTLTPATLRRFYRRMFGSAELMKRMEGRMPEIDFDERKEELRKIIEAAPYETEGIRWSKALLSVDDAIFPIKNMGNYWNRNSGVRLLPAPHYPFDRFKSWEELIRE